MNTLENITVPIDKSTMLCRLCLSVNEKLYQLFHSDETDTLAVSLSMKVSLCTAIMISKNDMLPQKICQNCLNYVNDWYMFRIKCKKVNSFLKKKILTTEKTGEKYNSLEENFKTSGSSSNEEKVLEDLDTPVMNKFENEKKMNLSKSNPSLLQDNFLTENKQDVNGDDVNSLVGVRKKKYKCSICPDSFYYLKDLKLHKSFIHNFIKAEDPVKKATISDPDIKLDGINVKTRYEMKCCDKVFFSKLKFRRHYSEKHPGEKPFMCETCGKKDFISEETLKRHKVLHTGKFRCEICSKTFTCNAILILHKRDKHENDKPFICDVCGKRFVTELLMNYHKRFHTGEKKYVCEECGLAVVTSSSLAKHKRIHSKEKPHVCHVCGKGFIIKGRLTEHLRVHTGERPFECQICRKCFTMRDKLKRHIRIHSGEKLFSCEYCGNNYSTRYGLSIHLKSHIGKYS